MAPTPSSSIQRVLLVFAMEAEAMPLIRRLKLQRDPADRIQQPAPCVTFSGKASSMDVHVVWNGRCNTHGVDNVGTVPAALSTYIASQAFKPDIIISAGTAGGFKARGAAIGDVFLSTAVVNHDRRIPLVPFDKYGLGYAETHPAAKMAAALQLKTGVVTSGNSLDCTDTDMEIMNKHEAAVKEMEGAAISWVAQMFGVPLLCVKAITDIVDGGRPSAEEFLENLHTAAVSLENTLPRVLEYMASKQASEL